MLNNIIVNNELDKDYLAMYRALSDRELRESLKQQADLDPGFKDLMRMMDDPIYIKMQNKVNAALKGFFPGMAMPKNLGNDIRRLRDYAGARYPEGWELLKEYERTAGCTVRGDSSSVIANVAVAPYIDPYIHWNLTVVVSTVLVLYYSAGL